MERHLNRPENYFLYYNLLKNKNLFVEMCLIVSMYEGFFYMPKPTRFPLWLFSFKIEL